MRVITGFARGKRLITLPGTDVVRPTAERVKEGLFSSIHFDLPGARVLDLFAGSGQLGIEALSRGARSCIFVDVNRDAQNVIKQNLRSAGLYEKAQVAAMDFKAFLSSNKATFDIAFLDPPYHQNLLPEALLGLVGQMAPNGVILCEHEKNEILPQKLGNFSIYREYKYGKIRITAYRNAEECDAL